MVTGPNILHICSGFVINKKRSKYLAERGRFELPVPEGTTVFETAAFNRSATSPFRSPLRSGKADFESPKGVRSLDLRIVQPRSSLRTARSFSAPSVLFIKASDSLANIECL